MVGIYVFKMPIIMYHPKSNSCAKKFIHVKKNWRRSPAFKWVESRGLIVGLCGSLISLVIIIIIVIIKKISHGASQNAGLGAAAPTTPP